jgi:hypothetical protein
VLCGRHAAPRTQAGLDRDGIGRPQGRARCRGWGRRAPGSAVAAPPKFRAGEQRGAARGLRASTRRVEGTFQDQGLTDRGPRRAPGGAVRGLKSNPTGRGVPSARQLYLGSMTFEAPSSKVWAWGTDGRLQFSSWASFCFCGSHCGPRRMINRRNSRRARVGARSVGTFCWVTCAAQRGLSRAAPSRSRGSARTVRPRSGRPTPSRPPARRSATSQWQLDWAAFELGNRESLEPHDVALQ